MNKVVGQTIVFSKQNTDNMIKYTSLFFCIFIFLSCDPPLPDVEPEPEPEVEMFQMQWATRMEPDRTIVTLNDIQQYGDIIIKSGEEESKLTTFYFFDKDTGEKLEKIILPDDQSVGNPGESAVYNNIYIVDGAYGILGFNLDTRQVDWRHLKEELDVSFLNVYFNGDRLFINTINKSEDFPALFEIDPLTGSIDEFYSVDSLGTFSEPVLYNGPEFDNEVAFMAYYPQLGTTPPQFARQDMIAVDTETKEILWRTTDFSQKFPCNYQLPAMLSDGVVMVGGDWSIYGFDMETGEQLWRTEVDPESGTGVFARTEHLLHDGLLYVNSFVFPLACIEPSTGEMLWRSLDAPNCARKMHYNEESDWIVVCSIGRGSILVFDANNGDLLHREDSYEGHSYIDNTIFDAERNMYFANTFGHTMGYKLVPK